jgi:hypothetical protein
VSSKLLSRKKGALTPHDLLTVVFDKTPIVDRGGAMASGGWFYRQSDY